MTLLVRVTCVVVPLELCVSSIFLYVYDRWTSLSVFTSSTILQKAKVQLIDKTRVPHGYK